MTNSIEVLGDDGGGGDGWGSDDDDDDEKDEEWPSRHMKMQGFSDRCAIACPSFKTTICTLV